MRDRLSFFHGRRELAAQALRYGLTGGFVTMIGVGAYAALVRGPHWPPLAANVGAYLLSMALGYVLHGRFSFRGHGSAGRQSARQGGKFLVTSGISFGLNSLFVWLFTGPFGWDALTPIAAMVFVTPAICFFIYRKWVFA